MYHGFGILASPQYRVAGKKFEFIAFAIFRRIRETKTNRAANCIMQ